MIEVDLTVEDERWDELGDVQALAEQAAAAAFAAAGRELAEPVEIGMMMADDEAVRVLNRDWRGKDKPTNVLSFPSSQPPAPVGPRHLGDIALAYETLVREAEAEGKTLRDHALHLLVHGVLHLLGYDHEDDAEADAMEAIEVAALAKLGVSDPYADEAA